MGWIYLFKIKRLLYFIPFKGKYKGGGGAQALLPN